MPRPRKFWRPKGRAYLYTKIDGKPVRLEKTEKASQRKLEKLLRAAGEGPAGPDPTFARVADLFLDTSQQENEEGTYEVHKFVLQSFKDHVGKKKVSKLCELDLKNWLKQQTTWNDNTKVRARPIVLAALNFGTRQLNLPGHPLRHVKPGTCDRREKALSLEERQKVHTSVKGVFAEYVTALELTGARPFSEVCKVTAADLDLEAGTWTLTKWKNSRKQKNKKRVRDPNKVREVLDAYQWEDIDITLQQESSGWTLEMSYHDGEMDFCYYWPTALSVSDLPSADQYPDEGALREAELRAHEEKGDEGFLALLHDLAPHLESPLLILAAVASTGCMLDFGARAWRTEPGGNEVETLSIYR